MLHPNTIRSWLRSIGDGDRADRLLGQPSWNKIHDGVRRVVREIRAAFPEPEFGTRTIARHLVRAGIRISRSSVRRALQEDLRDPRTDRQPQPMTQAPDHIQHPTQPHQVWHMDMTEIRVLWITVVVTAIVDGFTRRIIALRASRSRPTSDDLAGLIEDCVDRLGVTPRFLVTDHGCQFRQRFRGLIDLLGVRHVRCQVRTWQLNAKVERVFNDVKRWARRSWLPLRLDGVQLRLDAYRDWHNGFKPHAAHDTMTPLEAERGSPPPDPVAYLQRGGVEPIIAVQRRCVRGDPRLAYPAIRITERRLEAA
ncbi:MAG: DDE-type integrase/transposase/recombinase [Phycisphaerales bacterium]|nr:DDE-type integrase/transposase/recombinase [Phycisphaerales bacterium]